MKRIVQKTKKDNQKTVTAIAKEINNSFKLERIIK